MANEIPEWALEAAKTALKAIGLYPVYKSFDADATAFARIIAEACQQQLAAAMQEHSTACMCPACDKRRAELAAAVSAAEEAAWGQAWDAYLNGENVESIGRQQRKNGIGALARHDAKLREEWEKQMRLVTPLKKALDRN